MTLTESQTIWKKVLKQLKGALSGGIYRIHFQNSDVVAVDGDNWTIGVASQYSAEELEKKFKGMLSSFVEEYYDGDVVFIFAENIQTSKRSRVGEETSAQDKRIGPLFAAQNEEVYAQTTISLEEMQSPQNYPASQPQANAKPGQSTFNGLNPNLIFDSFIVGRSNNVAYAAAQAVAQNPGKSYNPLFIYGGVGLGKTHLMQSVGNAVLAKFPNKVVQYFPSERFINEFIQSLQTKTIDKFRARYRSNDIILVDDIQFISGKDSTQEEFFHTFNEIVGRGGHVLMTSDRTPEEMPQLGERLSSRFKGGMMVDIGLPDYEMRVAMIQAKCADMG
ncbi:MAG: DnaA/Hda family protein, partial [bacterium]|nr:DnaA/Hda family protein [bacterium]